MENEIPKIAISSSWTCSSLKTTDISFFMFKICILNIYEDCGVHVCFGSLIALLGNDAAGGERKKQMSISLINPLCPQQQVSFSYFLACREKAQRLGVNLLLLFSHGVFFSPATCSQSYYLDSKERARIC